MLAYQDVASRRSRPELEPIPESSSLSETTRRADDGGKSVEESWCKRKMMSYLCSTAQGMVVRLSRVEMILLITISRSAGLQPIKTKVLPLCRRAGREANH